MDELAGRYKILRQLGRGAMGVVYLALDPALNRQVAIKTVDLDTEGASEKEFLRERILRDARAAAMLTHPNIVSVYDIFEQAGKAYLVMEFIEGDTLAARLGASEKLDTKTTLRLLREMAAALDYTHSRGVIHRDVKPANVMIDAAGSAKIMDFGIARITDARTTTPTGMVMGTVEFMAPEQIKGEPLDGRADQFSLAAVAYQTMTGSTLYGPHTLATLAYKIVTEMPPPARSRNPGLPQALDRVFEKALAKAPSSRFATCREFVDALDEAFYTAPTAPMPVGPVQPLTSPPAPQPSAPPVPAASAAFAQAMPVQLPVRAAAASQAGTVEFPPPAPAPGKTSPLLWIAAVLCVLAAAGAIMVWKPWAPVQSPVSSAAAPSGAKPSTDSPASGHDTPTASAATGAVAAQAPPVPPVKSPSLPAKSAANQPGKPELSVASSPSEDSAGAPEAEPEEKGVPRPAADALHQGQALVKQNQYLSAIESFNKAIALRPNYALAHMARGSAYRHMALPDAAAKDFTEVIRIRPRDAVAYAQRGMCLSHLNQDDAALADFNQALAIRPDFADALNGTGLIFMHRKQYENAITEFTEAIRVSPDFAPAYRNRGHARHALGREPGSVADIKKADELVAHGAAKKH